MPESQSFSHAGGVVVRHVSERREYLLVRARRSPVWVFPKGHIEPGETPEQAAVREVGEEGGVRAEVVAPAGVSTFFNGIERVAVVWFSMRQTGAVVPGEQREARWCGFEDARRLLGYDNLRELLDGVERTLGPG
jgi:8-oxo-dGTP pyrophosphatase MutT (NUDIX family)